MYSITFHFEEEDKPAISVKAVEPGYTILDVAMKNEVVLNHRCGGICSCTTCHVIVKEGSPFLIEKGQREIDFLRKIPNAGPLSRLACQSLLEEGNGEMEILIPLPHIV